MVTKSQSRARAAAFLDGFTAAGAQVIEADILQPAEVLLDLYGEDIRARAYVTSDPLQGECMMRPDFTVPVVRQHMEGGAQRAAGICAADPRPDRRRKGAAPAALQRQPNASGSRRSDAVAASHGLWRCLRSP